MTTNTWQLVDILQPLVHSVTVVHPPEVKAIVRARVMTDKIAARILAQLHAADLLPAVWVPPRDVREVRSLVAGRQKMVRLSTRAKNSLHALLHARQIPLPEVKDPFHPSVRDWWEALPLSLLERTRLLNELDTLDFAKAQLARYEETLAQLAAEDERVPLLVQLPGISVLGAMTILGAIGAIERFPTAKKLVGYSGLCSQVHDSGQKRWTGSITKRGRRDLRRVMVDAAHKAAKVHGHWKEQFERLAPRIGRPKAFVAIARKMLVAVWHILTKAVADKHADPEQVARAFFAHAYKVGVDRLPEGLSAREYVRFQLDQLEIGQELTHFMWGKKRIKLPRSPGT